MEKVNYKDLNAKQKEIYNFQKVSGIFADFGYTTVKLSDDWMGADFIAISFKGDEFIKVQLKGRLTFEKKYIGKKIHICFHDSSNQKWYLYDHDLLLEKFLENIKDTQSWIVHGSYSYPGIGRYAMKALENCFLG